MSSAGYHLGAFSEAVGTALDPPFFAPPICFAVADILLDRDKPRQQMTWSLALKD